MKHEQSNIALLPTGFVDLMPEDAETEARAINILMDLFAGHGYRRIKPPLLEFEDSLLAPGPGAALAQDTFRLMDPVSHRMMGLRADITPQIARIVCTRLPEGDESIRLMYANDVLRTKSGQMRSSRQFCQVGCEIIRDDSVEGYIEALMLIILGLKNLGLNEITIDVTIPRLLDYVLDGMQLDAAKDANIRQAIAKRDSDYISNLDERGGDILLSLLSCIGDAREAIGRVDANDLPSDMQTELDKLVSVVDGVYDALDDMEIKGVNLAFDPFESKGFEYQNGIAFTVFSKDIKGELGRGGYYDVRFGNSADSASEQAIGFTLFMDTIRPELKFDFDAKMLAVSSAASWSEVEACRAQGWQIVRYQNEDHIPDACTHILKNNKPEKR